MGVFPVPGLMAANGPVVREDVKLFTATLLLRGLLLTQQKKERREISDQRTHSLNLCDAQHLLHSSLVGVNLLGVSQLFACCLCVLLGPVVTAHTPPT